MTDEDEEFARIEREAAIRATTKRYYNCVVCMRQIEAIHGVFSHDDVPHPPDMTFDEDRNPQ